MRKFYSGILSALLFSLASIVSNAQITVTTDVPPNLLYNSATADGAIVFGLRNTNPDAVTITEIGNYVPAGFSGTLTLWYHTTAVTGAPTAINTTNGWTALPPVTINNNPSAGIRSIFTGLSINLPANTTYRFAISGPPFAPYYAPANTTANSYTGGGLVISSQDNAISPGYGGNFPGPPANTPRGFIGRVTFTPSNTCTQPPVPGTPTATPSSLCSGANFTLSVPGPVGTGQTYQWQSSTDNINFTNYGASSSSPVLVTSQTATRYYRVIVTCGTSSVTSSSVQVTTSGAPVSGTFTINSAVATGGSNFQTFAAAVSHISGCGINGPVVFNVAAGSGPYTEQVSIPAINGTSATNTITFNGNGATLQFTPVTANRYVLQLNGADRVTINGLNITSLDATFGWGIHLTNGADNNTITNSTIDVSAVTNTTQSNSAGIVGSGTLTSTTTDGDASNNTISNNTIIGGYNGIIINGEAPAVNANNNLITGNTIRDFYLVGVELTDNNGTQIVNNNIHRTNRITVGSPAAGVELGTGNINTTVTRNRIHDMHTSATTQSGTAYGIFSNLNDAPSGSENKVTNNLIYNFNSLTGTQYGLYNSSSDGVHYFHNTVVLDHAASTSGTTRGIFQTTLASNIQYRNNIVYITRGGTGTKHALYFGTTTSTITSNNNVLYVNTTAGSTVGIGSLGTTNYATLANWQAAPGAYDAASISVNPQFTNPSTGHFYPENPAVATAGVPVGVTIDLLGITRSTTTPTPGAYEVSNTGCTSPPTAGTSTASPSTPMCIGGSVTLTLTGNSFGAGQTFQWQQSTTQNGTYTNIGAAQTNPAYTLTPTQTMWYRAAVTCSGNTTFSAPVQVILNPPFPAGTYTINKNAATGGTNFNSFAAAVSALNCGIAGPVVFNVVSGSGPYEEVVTIPEIGNSSATNTVTFNGNGETVNFNTVTGNRAIIRLDGADNIILKKLKIEAQSGSTFGWGIHLTNGSDNNFIDSNIIDLSVVTNTTQSNSGGIVASGSTTSVTTAGNANRNTISNNTIIGAYQGIIIVGSTTALNAVGNRIINNEVRDWLINGIEISGNDSAIVRGNNIHRSNRTDIGTTASAGIELSGGTIKSIVDGNRIHDSHTAATTLSGTFYGIYSNADDAPTGSENKVINNLIYRLNSLTGIQYGLYNSSSDGVHYYHNTVVLDHTASTAGNTRGFYQTTTAINIRVRNNIFYITRGGTGTKHALYFNTAASAITSNNNVLYVNTTAGSPIGIGSIGTTNYATLAAWQAAPGGYDAASISVDPAFASPATGNYYPNNSAIASVGAAVGVTTDIVGIPRDAVTPTPGAYEIVAAVGLDVGATTLVAPVQQICYSTAQTVTVRIRNFSANTINFVSSPVTVNVSVTGPNATTFTPVVVNTGTLAADATLDVVISTNYNMSAPGAYVFNASTSVTGDVSATNNAMPAATINVAPLEVGTASSNPAEYCITGGTPTLTLAGNTGTSTIQWQVASSATGPWTNVGTSSTTYTPAAAITATTYYRAYGNCGTNADTSNVVTVTLNTPQLLSSTPGTRCGPGSVVLSATGSAGASFNWYETATGGAPIGTGAIFNTPVINATKTFYVTASSGGGGTTHVGMAAVSADPTSGAGQNTFGIYFDAISAFTLQSVVVYPVNATAGTPGTVTIAVINDAGTVLHQATVNVIGYPTAAPVGQTVTLNFPIVPGTNYRLVPIARTGITGLLFEPSVAAAPYPYPYTVPGVVTLKYSSLATGTPRLDLYYYFYNWQISTGCETPRQAVTATITAAPAFDVTGNTTICNNAVKALAVTSPTANFNTYSWTPVTGLYTDAAGTTPYTGGSATTVYVKNATAGTYTYVATANNTSTSCQNIDSVKVTVLPATLALTALQNELCVSGSTTINLPAADYGAATFEWQSSPDGTNFTPITGASGNSYTTPNISATTHYRVLVKSSDGSTCLQPSRVITVNSPQILTTTPAALCGTGPLTLQATASPGSTINWYAAATGGLPLATGGTFTTPSLTNNTTYYVGATQGGAIVNVGVASVTDLPNVGVNSTLTAGMEFDVLSPSVTIQSVDIFPTSPVGTPFKIVVRAGSATSTTIVATYEGVTTVSGTVTAPVVQTVPVNFVIPSGTNYAMTFFGGAMTAPLTGTAIYPGALRNNPATGATFPYTVPGTLSITGASLANVWYYFYNWRVGTGCESPRTAVQATVNAATVITSQPASVATCSGGNVTFTVGANGANLTYQWKKNNVDIAGATSASYTINGATPSNDGTYTVVITGLCGSVTSSSATLAVAPGNSWLGVTSTDWNTPSNWCGGVPTSTSDISITAGTPFQPVLNSVGEVRNLTIANGATLTITSAGFLNLYGNYTNNGTFNATNGVVLFRGTANQTIGAMNIGSVIMNGNGVTLAGNLTIGSVITLMNGHISLGANNLVLNTSSNGTTNSHIITNGTGSVVGNNITTAFTIPVGPDAGNYNPVIISNGQGLNYSVRVATGVNPAVANNARAINRTWNITPSAAPAANVNIVYQFEDDDVNSSASPTILMEVGVHNGTQWNVVSPALGVTPSGGPTNRQVGVSTSQFGPMVVTNIGGITNPLSTPNVNPDVTQLLLLPNVVEGSAILRTDLRRAMKINWIIMDANGRVVYSFGKQMMAGQTDQRLDLSRLANGSYLLLGLTEKGKTQVIRFIRQ